jgi:integrase
VLALHCGLREGKLLRLRWDDVAFSGSSATLQIRRTLSETRTVHKFDKPKNGKGRSVKLSQKATEALRSHRARQNEEEAKGVGEPGATPALRRALNEHRGGTA